MAEGVTSPRRSSRLRPALLAAAVATILALLAALHAGVGPAAGLHAAADGAAAADPAAAAAAVPPELRKDLDALARCETLDCVSRAGARLRGRARFNAPHFMILGWQKCATTSIYRHLARHPQVLKPLFKEPHFFTGCQRGGRNCKVAGGPNERAYTRDTLRVRAAAAGGLTAAALDASVDYAQEGETLAARLAALFPWLRLVFVVRERGGRAMSWKNMMEAKYQRGCTGNLDSCLLKAVDKANYSAPLEAWLRHFPAEQVRVVQFEELGEDMAGGLESLKRFLGLDPALPRAEFRNVNAREGSSGWRVSRTGYERVVASARRDAVALAALLEGRSLAHAAPFLARWEAIWARNLGACSPEGECTISSS